MPWMNYNRLALLNGALNRHLFLMNSASGEIPRKLKVYSQEGGQALSGCYLCSVLGPRMAGGSSRLWSERPLCFSCPHLSVFPSCLGYIHTGNTVSAQKRHPRSTLSVAVCVTARVWRLQGMDKATLGA